MHVVVVGCGRVGSGLAASLTREGHSVAIIDRDARAFRRLPEDWDGERINGSGFDRDDLDRAGASRADALAAVTNGDNTNILTVRIARETYGIDRVVARIYDPRRAEIYQRLGIPTVATVTWTIDQVRRRLLPATIAREWSDPSGKLLLIERPVPDGWAGRRLGGLAIPGRVAVVAVSRAGTPRLDVQDLIGQEGDVLHMAVASDALEEMEQRLAEVPALGTGRKR
jgi:trk system potassium uptake protein